MRVRPSVAMLAATGALLVAGGSACAAPTSFSDVRQTIESVTSATGVRYDAKDDAGRNLEGLKVIASAAPGGAKYVGVFHNRSDGVFDSYVGTSDDLLTWETAARIDSNASQPTIKRLDDGSYLVAYEKHDPNHVRLRRYTTVEALTTATHREQFDAPLTLAATAEGTPDIRSVQLRGGLHDSTITVGFHYYWNQDVDRMAEATLENFRSWTARPRESINEWFSGQGLRGNFGDRDTFSVDGRDYEILEAQATKDDWGSWRTFLRDVDSDVIEPLHMSGEFGQTAYGNPTVTILPGPHGGTVLFTTAFLFTEGAPRGAGSMLSYHALTP